MSASGDETRNRIQNRALNLFKERGYNNVTIDDICTSLEITRGTFYYHFSNKENLFDLLYNEPFAFDINAMAKVFNTDNCWEKYMVLHERGFEWIVSTGHEFLSTLIRLALEKKHKHFFPAMSRAYDEITAGIIDMGQEQNHFLAKGSPITLSHIARDIVIGIMQDWCCSDGDFDIIESAKLALSTLFQVREDMLEYGHRI